MSQLKLIFLFLFFTLFSCKQSKIDNLVIFKVKRSDFVNKIEISGVIDSKKKVSIRCPEIENDARIIYLCKEGITVKKGDTICLLQCESLENQYREALKELEIAKSELIKITTQLNLDTLLLEANILTKNAATSKILLDSVRLEFYTPVRKVLAELELEKALIEKNSYIKKKSLHRKINSFVIQKLKLKIIQFEVKANLFKEKLDLLTLVSNAEGIIEYSRLWSTESKAKEGDVVWDRMSIVEIIDMSGMQVKMNMDENNFKSIQKDQLVEIRIESLNNLVLKGKITKKSPAGKKIKKDSQVKYFEVFSSVDSLNINVPPGISVNCVVYIEKIKDTISVPFISIIEEDSFKYINKIVNNKIVKDTVITGSSSNTETIILKGIKQGDLILLNKPTS